MMKLLLVCLSLLALVNVQCLTFSVSNSTDVVRRQHVTATFGPQEYQVSGRVQVADPAELCVLPPPGLYTTDIRIMFILRGNCTFYQKAQNAMALGASAVVIANAQIIGSDDPFLLGYPADLSPSAITIPVVCVGKATFDSIIAAHNETHGLVTVELKNRQGHDGSSGGNFPPHRHDSSSSSSSSGSSGQAGPFVSSTADMSTGMNSDVNHDDGHDDGKPRPPHRSPRSWMLAVGITAIVASSCLCGFCIGRHCGAGRRCSRNRAAHVASVSHVAPVASLVVHQGYTQVDMESAPAGYYGQEMMPVVVPVPSAPAYSPSAPNSAEIRYA